MRSSKEILLVDLRRIASADTVEEFEKEVKILKEREVWKLEQSKRFRSWMEKTWLPERKAKIILESDFIGKEELSNTDLSFGECSVSK